MLSSFIFSWVAFHPLGMRKEINRRNEWGNVIEARNSWTREWAKEKEREKEKMIRRKECECVRVFMRNCKHFRWNFGMNKYLFIFTQQKHSVHVFHYSKTLISWRKMVFAPNSTERKKKSKHTTRSEKLKNWNGNKWAWPKESSTHIHTHTHTRSQFTIECKNRFTIPLLVFTWIVLFFFSTLSCCVAVAILP